MKLYHATTVYQFLNVVAHIQKDNSFGEDTIIFAPWLRKKFENAKILKLFFKKTCFYDAAIYRIPEDQLEEAINNNINKFLADNKIDLQEFDEIIVGGVQYNFGIYLCYNKIKFSVIEESCGILSRPEVIEQIDSKNPYNTERVNIAKKYELYQCTNENIVKVYCDLSNQKEGFVFDKTCDFKVLEILKTLDEKKLDIILSLFGIKEKISLNKNSVFLLTQQFSSLKILSLKQQILIYQLFSDFFLEGKDIFIKPHPDDVCYYSQLIKNSTVIREKFPSELTPFVFETLPDTIATISSTGIAPLKHLFKNTIQLDFKYEKGFENTIKYFVALQAASKLNIEKCTLVGGDSVLLEQLAKINKMSFEIENAQDISTLHYSQNSIVIIDCCSHEEINISQLLKMNFDAYLFLNTDHSFGFYRYNEKESLSNIIPIKIKKTLIRNEDNYLNKNDEFIYAYSPNKEILDEMKKLEIEKSLNNTGVFLNVNQLTDEQLEIERLKGILAATEKRLLYYLNKEKENDED